MKYVLLFVVLVALGLAVLNLARSSKEYRARVWAFWRPLLPIVALSWLAVLAAILIAYFGGHIRVL